ncbi:hypothetical protein [Maribacter sp. 2307ULW6-5]|uniref:hypothetical protein n=1 Tax=Maribacter sp. 2307ULW6-5 TaxID=3386275 RepID=UPI0039BD6E74
MSVNKKKFRQAIRAQGLLWLLMLADALFMAGHAIAWMFWDAPTDMFLLNGSTLGLAEGFQYLKYLGILCLLAYLIGLKKQHAYLPLFFLFAFLFADDVSQLHNRASWVFVHRLQLQPLAGVHAQPLGKIFYTATIASLFMGVSGRYYLKASSELRRAFRDILVLLAGFLFFGVGLDVFQTFFVGRPRIGFWLTLTEEGGEMLVLSLLLWYLYCLFLPLKHPWPLFWGRIIGKNEQKRLDRITKLR